MTSEHPQPRLAKGLFFLGDALLLAAAAVIVYRGAAPLGLGQTLGLVASVALGAWLAIYPFLVEYRTQAKLLESEALTTAVLQIQNLETVARQISSATARWQTAQEHAEQTVTASREIAERMAAEAKEFAEFMQKANDAEKGRLRLEVDKMRRAEGEWLQVLVRVLDHVYALHVAAMRSGQPGLSGEIGNFQTACRDSARRIGLVPFTAEVEEAFAAERHQLLDAQMTPAAGARVAETVAAGYTFQGQLLRKALVTLQPDLPQAPESPQPLEPTAKAADEPSGKPAPAAAEAPAAAPAEDRDVALYEPPPDETSESQLSSEWTEKRDSAQ